MGICKADFKGGTTGDNRYMLYYHPLLCFVVFTPLFLGGELRVGLSLWVVASLYTSQTLQQAMGMDELQPQVPWVRSSPRSMNKSPLRSSAPRPTLQSPTTSQSSRSTCSHAHRRPITRGAALAATNSTDTTDTDSASGGIVTDSEADPNEITPNPSEIDTDSASSVGVAAEDDPLLVALASSLELPHDDDLTGWHHGHGRMHSLARLSETTEESTSTTRSSGSSGTVSGLSH